MITSPPPAQTPKEALLGGLDLFADEVRSGATALQHDANVCGYASESRLLEAISNAERLITQLQDSIRQIESDLESEAHRE